MSADLVQGTTQKSRANPLRRKGIITLGAVIFIMLIPTAFGAQITAGAMKALTNGTDACTVAPVDDTYTLSAETVTFLVTYTIKEQGTTEDKWEFALTRVNWIDWPTDALGNGGPPPNDEVGESVIVTDNYGQDDSRALQELTSRTWDSGDFELSGTYKAEVSMEMTYSNREWNKGQEFVERCGPSDQALIQIEYSKGSGDAEIIIE